MAPFTTVGGWRRERILVPVRSPSTSLREPGCRWGSRKQVHGRFLVGSRCLRETPGFAICEEGWFFMEDKGSDELV